MNIMQVISSDRKIFLWVDNIQMQKYGLGRSSKEEKEVEKKKTMRYKITVLFHSNALNNKNFFKTAYKKNAVLGYIRRA